MGKHVMAYAFGATAALAVAASTSAVAATLLEFDFQNVSGSTTTALTATASPTGTLHEGATVNAAGIAVANSTNPKLQTGYLNIPRDGAANLSSVSPASGWRDYHMESYGTGTISIVYRPNFDGIQTADGNAGRFYFFGYRSGGNSSEVSLFNSDNIDGIEARFDSGVAAGVPNFDWDSDTWYLLSFSWSVGSEVRLFVAELDPAGDTYYAESEGTIGTGNTSRFTVSPAIGAAGNTSGGPDGSNANGQIAYFLWTDQYTTEAGFETFAASLIPEPTGLVSLLCILGGSLATRRPRRRQSS